MGDGPTTWRAQLEGLSDEFDVIAWDGPGAGASDDPPDSFRMPDFADVLAGFISALGLDRPHVAGLSFGGSLALEFYRRHPETSTSLVLASAYAGWAGSLPAGEVEHRLNQVLELADLPPDRFASQVAPTMFSDSASSELVRSFTGSITTFHPAGLRTMALAVAEADLRDVLPEIGVPTLLVYGEQDVRAPEWVVRSIHDAIRGSMLVVLPGVGHVCCAEAPDAFNDSVRSFLRGVGN